MDEFELKHSIKDFFETMAKRPLHRVITPELISKQSDKDLEVTIFDIAWAVRSPDRLLVLSSLPDGYSIVYPTMALEAEVTNGGFDQFFTNPTKVLYSLAVEGYKRLELLNIVTLVERANQMYGAESLSRRKVSPSLSRKLAGDVKSYGYHLSRSLDQQMWAAKETISAKRIPFIRNNAHLFLGDFRHMYDK